MDRGIVFRELGMVLLGVLVTMIGYLGLTGSLSSSPILGLALILVALYFAYSIGKKRVQMQQGDRAEPRRT